MSGTPPNQLNVRSHYLFESVFCTPGRGNEKGLFRSKTANYFGISRTPISFFSGHLFRTKPAICFGFFPDSMRGFTFIGAFEFMVALPNRAAVFAGRVPNL